MSKRKPSFPTVQQARRGQEDRTPSKTFNALARSSRLQTVAIDKVQPNPDNPRKAFDQDKLQRLADSIRERGILQPPVVRPADADGIHILRAGERRLRAARLAGLTEIEVLVGEPVEIRDELSDALLENLVREDLSPIEEARALATLIEDLGLTHEQAGRRVGRSRSAITNQIRLLDLPDRVLDYLDGGDLTAAHGHALLSVKDHDQRKRLGRQAAELGWSKRTLQNAVEQLENRPARKTPSRQERAEAADAQDAAERLTDAFALAGHQVTVKVTKKGVTLTLTDVEAAEQLLAATAAKARKTR